MNNSMLSTALLSILCTATYADNAAQPTPTTSSTTTTQSAAPAAPPTPRRR